MAHALDIIGERVVRDGCVAVLVSHGFGAGWYSWHHIEALVYDPVVVEMVLEDRIHEIESYVHGKYPDDKPYCGGTEGLRVHWVSLGQRFRIDEYDGSESLKLESEEEWLVA